jgi:hypothetical protein
MRTKQLFAGAAMAAILAVTMPAHAQRLGGAVHGGFGGGFSSMGGGARGNLGAGAGGSLRTGSNLKRGVDATTQEGAKTSAHTTQQAASTAGKSETAVKDTAVKTDNTAHSTLGKSAAATQSTVSTAAQTPVPALSANGAVSNGVSVGSPAAASVSAATGVATTNN